MSERDVDLEALVAEIEATAAARVAAGEYEPDLDRRLEAHYRRIVEQLPRPFDQARLDGALARVSETSNIDPSAIDTSSGLPGGSAIHRLAGRAIGRQTAGLAQQLNRFTVAVTEALSVLAEATRHPMSHGHPGLQGAIDLMLDHAAIEAPFTRPPEVDWRPTIERVSAGASVVLEIEGTSALDDAADGSVDVVSALGALGRIGPHGIVSLATAARVKLRDGGVLLVGGIEPVSVDAIAAAMAVSPYALVHPGYVEALLGHRGFVTTVERLGDLGAFAVVATRTA